MRHPVQQLLQHHGYSGTIPSADELAELKVDASTAAAIKAATTTAAAMHADGFQGQAHQHALAAAQETVSKLPAAQQDPGYLKPDPNEGLDGLGPAELAARVARI